MLTVGCGQRLGLIAGSGVGKSVLLGMLTKFTSADVVVIGLIGERGREVKEFIEQILGPEGMGHAVVVAAPADNSPLLRIRATNLAHLYAEYFRAKGKDVLLLVDSMSRVAHAQREIGLAIGEPPTSKGYPPSVFSLLPNLIEFTGTGSAGQGSTTALYTLLPRATIYRTGGGLSESLWMGKWCSAERWLTPCIIPPLICPVLFRGLCQPLPISII